MKSLKKFSGVILADFAKIFRMKSFYIGIAVMVFITILFAVAENALSSLVESYPAEGQPVDTDAVTALFSFSLLNAAPSSTLAFILVAIITGLAVGTDFSSGMTRVFVGRGVRKYELYLSKLLVISVVSVIYVCLSFAMCSAAARAICESQSTFDSLAYYTPAAFGAYIFLAIVLSAINTSVCFAVRSKAGSIAALFAMFIILGDILVLVVQIALGVAVNGENSAAGYVYLLLDPYYLPDALSTVRIFTSKELGLVFGGGAMWTVLFTAGGLLLNEKRDVK